MEGSSSALPLCLTRALFGASTAGASQQEHTPPFIACVGCRLGQQQLSPIEAFVHAPPDADASRASASAAAKAATAALDANSQLYESLLFQTYSPACAAVTPQWPPSHTMAVLAT